MVVPSQKGGDFERAQAKALSYWASGGTSYDLLWRTAGSGGRHTRGAIKGYSYGDLQVLKPTDESMKFMQLFCVELKHYQEFDFMSEWLCDKSNLKKWWYKLKIEAISNGVQPLLIVKANRKPTLMFFSYYDFIKTNGRDYNIYSLGLNFLDEKLIGFVQDDFFKVASLSDFTVRTKVK